MPAASYQVMSPSSINFTGTSASIGGGGSVTFSAVSSLSLNNIFNSTYTNYKIIIRNTSSNAGTVNLLLRLRKNGVDETTDAGPQLYYYETVQAYGTSIYNAYLAAQGFPIGFTTNNTYEGRVIDMYEPFLEKQTTYRCISSEGYQTNFLTSHNGAHVIPASYDGFTLYPLSGTITGLISVYGVTE